MDNNVFPIPKLSWEHMIKNCYDFKNEQSQFEAWIKGINHSKYHAEYAGAGESIEDSWGLLKSLHLKSPLKMKKGKDNFDKLATRCISFRGAEERRDKKV